MNIKVQACGFVLLVILYLLYHQQHTLQTYSRRAFLRFYAVTVLCILMDILSIVAIESASHLPALFVTFVCKTYLITLVLTALCGVMYIGVDILLSNKAFRKTEHLILLITSVVCLSIYLLPISIYCYTHRIHLWFFCTHDVSWCGRTDPAEFCPHPEISQTDPCAQTHRNVTLDARMDTLSNHPVFKS